MHKVFAPHLNRNVIIGGCKMPDRHAPMLKLRDYMKMAALPASPVSCDYSGPAMSVITNIEGNGQYGDCVEAEDAHFIALVTGNTGKLFSYTPALTLDGVLGDHEFQPEQPGQRSGHRSARGPQLLRPEPLRGRDEARRVHPGRRHQPGSR